jgi:TatD DNase family protein
MLIDTHCHIQFKAYNDDRNEVIVKSVEKNVVMNAVGTQQETSKKAVELAEKHENIYASVGLHPIQKYVIPVKEEDTEFTARGEEFDFDFYDALISSSEKIIAVGETGLDRFHIPKDISGEELFEKQKETFLEHYKLAKKHDLPLVIHIRDAHEDMMKILAELPKPVKGVVHCFTGNKQQADFYIEAGLHLGFTGVITFPPKKTDPKPQEELIEVVQTIPADRILVETDSPFLAPQAHRGKRAEPWMVEECAKKIAELRGSSVEEIEKLTTENAKKLFNRMK